MPPGSSVELCVTHTERNIVTDVEQVERSGMKPSDQKDVADLYEDTADSYSAMMDTEILSSAYVDTLDRLHERLESVPGALVDTSCGSGHMLALYAERHGIERELRGVDLTPRMVVIAQAKLGASAEITVGDMRELSAVADDAAGAVVSYFALHHLDLVGIEMAFRDWHRALNAGGQLVIALWEGSGVVDYGKESDIVAFKYQRDEIASLVEAAGFSIDRCDVEVVEDMDMNAIYLEATCT